MTRCYAFCKMCSPADTQGICIALDAPSKDPPQSTGQLHRAKPSPAMEHLGPRQHESALTTVRGALAPPAIVEPAGELPSSAPQQRDRLSVAYLPTSRLSPQATSKASRDRATLVASSPLSGDLHIAASPSRGNDALQRSIKSIEQEQTQRLSVFLSDNDASFTGSSNDLKQSDRPRSEPGEQISRYQCLSLFANLTISLHSPVEERLWRQSGPAEPVSEEIPAVLP